MKERVECDVGSGYGSLETEYERWKRDRVARLFLYNFYTVQPKIVPDCASVAKTDFSATC